MKVLLATLPLSYGGVATHARHAIGFLKAAGHEVTVAYYLPYGMCPELSVPTWRLGRRRPTWREKQEAQCRVVELGCWLPELEFAHHLPTAGWRNLIDTHQALLVISGTPMAGLVFARSHRPFLAWLGTPYDADRQQRVREFPPWRKLIDRAVIRPACKAIEREVLNAGAIVPTGEYAWRGFQPLAPEADIRPPIGIPVQTAWFQPAPAKVQLHTIGFAGRFNDPRKNIGLLIEATRICRARGVPVQLMLVGEKPSRAVERLIRRSGLADCVAGLEKLSAAALRQAYQSMSVFVVPSQQEGLCVAALEAMACGCPVVTTRCGGPEEFVTDAENGFIVPADGATMADKITLLLEDRSLHKRFSEAARARVVQQYAYGTIAERFLQEFEGYIKRSG